MGIFDKIFKRDKSDQENNAPIEIPNGELLHFLRYEATFRTQEYRFPRFHEKSNPATIGSVLNVIASELLPHIKSMSCVRTGEIGKTLDVRYESDPSSIINTRLFPLVRTRNNKGEYIPLKGENVTFILKFNDEAPAREAIVFLRGTPGQVTGYTYCMRVSVMIPQSRNPFLTSFIILEDYSDTSALMKEFERIETPALAKYRTEEKFTSESEWAIIRGIYEQHVNAAYIAWGRDFMKNCRWRDGYNLLIRAFRQMATSVLSAQKEQLGVYYEVAHYIGICLEHLERYDEAAYFLWVAHNNDEMGLEDLVRVYARLCDLTMPRHLKSESFMNTRDDARRKLQLTTSEDFSSRITVGYVFNELYGAKLGNLTSMVIIRKGNLESKIFITDEDEVWDYPMRDLLDDDTKVIVTYSPVRYAPGTIKDKSTLHFESSFIISINTANEDNGLMRVNVMLPNFPYDDDKAYGSDRINTPDGVSFIMSKEVMRYNQIGKNMNSLLAVSHSLSDEGRIIEALHAARYAYSYLISRWDLLEEDWRGFMASVAYQIGFCLMDFKLYSKANYYLRTAASAKVVKHVIGFIDSFVKINDRHLVEMIEVYEKIPNERYDSIEYDNFIKFLKRRKVRIFIEMKRYDDAEALLNEMLGSDDEKSRDFATSELEYLRNLRSR